MPDVPLTRAQWVDGQLRDSILSGELAPGERLMTAMLAERYAVSPTPLREALQRLAAEGLVEITPQRGARVALLSVQDALELLELRALLEDVALDRALDAADDPWEAEVRGAAKELRATLARRGRRSTDIELADRQLHKAVLAPCPSGQLRRISANLMDQWARYHVLILERSSGIAPPVVGGDDFVRACLDRRSHRARRLLAGHLGILSRAVHDLEEQGRIVADGAVG